MPRPTDNNITLWKNDYTGADTNIPQGSEVVGSFLDDQLRLVKDTVRQESVNKQWERWKGVISSFAFVNATTFTMPGDQRLASGGPCDNNRRIKATVTAGTVYGYITSVAFAGGTTTVTVALDGGALDAGLSEVQFGTPTATNPSIIQTAFLQNTTPLFAVASGTNTYTATLTPAITAYTTGQLYVVQFTNGNTGAATLALNGLAAKSIVKNGATALVSGDIGANQVRVLYFDGTNFQLESAVPSFSGAATTVAMGTSGSFATLVGTANVQAGSVGTPASTSETTLFSYSLPGGSLASNGQYILVHVAWQDNGQSGNRSRFKFGATTLWDSGTAGFSQAAQRYQLYAMVIRTGAATQQAFVVPLLGGNAAPFASVYSLNPTETLSGAISVVFTGTNGSPTANAIVGNIWVVQYGS